MMTNLGDPKTIGITILVLGSLLDVGSLTFETFAQEFSPGSQAKSPKQFESLPRTSPVPFADYEKRLRQSARWRAMNSEDQAEALEKIALARKKFLDRQQEMHKQYDIQFKKLEKTRQSLMSKRRKREQFDASLLWERYQTLPIKQRLELERQLGLDTVLTSQQRQQFQNRLDRLSLSKRRQIVRQLQQVSP